MTRRAPPRPGWPALFAACLAVGLTCGLLKAAQEGAVLLARGEPPAWTARIVAQLPYWLLWGAMAPAIIALATDASRRALPARQVGLRLAGGLCAAVLVVPALTMVIYQVVPSRTSALRAAMPVLPAYGLTVLIGAINNALLFASIAGVSYAIAHAARLRDQELASAALGAQLTQARMDALRSQLNPHFLFNTMNSIAMMMRSGEAADAVRMLAGLSDLLRSVLDDSVPHDVPLRRELAFAAQYLAIEQVRFPDRLRVMVDVDPTVADALVPAFILQPLVENAVHHGIAPDRRGGLIEITGRRAGDALLLEVRNDGAPLPETVVPGVGLGNTLARLRHRHGTAAELTLTLTAEGRTSARILLPLEPQGAGAAA
ncbi:MAG: histidine kinase [Gemmatimonadetes bacterium]|nr:histidine kinase [Gemmatimonadota bacterium]